VGRRDVNGAEHRLRKVSGSERRASARIAWDDRSMRHGGRAVNVMRVQATERWHGPLRGECSEGKTPWTQPA
jgi:hypothetical protein